MQNSTHGTLPIGLSHDLLFPFFLCFCFVLTFSLAGSFPRGPKLEENFNLMVTNFSSQENGGSDRRDGESDEPEEPITSRDWARFRGMEPAAGTYLSIVLVSTVDAPLFGTLV